MTKYAGPDEANDRRKTIKGNGGNRTPLPTLGERDKRRLEHGGDSHKTLRDDDESRASDQTSRH